MSLFTVMEKALGIAILVEVGRKDEESYFEHTHFGMCVLYSEGTMNRPLALIDRT